jgi:hypothetical protein
MQSELASRVNTTVFMRIYFFWDVIFSIPFSFENGSTTFLLIVEDQVANDRLLSLIMSDTEVALCSVRPKPVQPAAANVQLPVQRTFGADWQI